MDIKKIQGMFEIYGEKDKMPCPVIHFIASSLDITPLEVGDAATELGVRIYMCQLGLFGYGRKGQSGYKILGRKVEVPQEVLDLIKAKAVDGRISCLDLWEIADKADIIRAEVGNAADSLGLKITPCQLGAFNK